MDFVKMEGLGNDFVVIEGPFTPSKEQVTAWCDRRRGIGADGVLVLTPETRTSVRMGYWNADGSAAEMCGNGLRCVARRAVDVGAVDGSEFIVITPMGERQVAVSDDTVRAELGPVAVSGDRVRVRGLDLATANVGNPHAVTFVDDVATAPIGDQGPLVEADAAFPGGVNVGFARIVSPARLELRVWERGVGETLACGTGASAAVAVAAAEGKTGSRVAVALPGGVLLVEILEGVAWIEGPARTVFSGKVE